MLIGGLQKTSLIDYPDKVSAVIFTAGCNFRCHFCHNPELVDKIDKKSLIKSQQVFEFLNKRKKTLDAVVITGGEPTLHQDLPEFIQKIKDMGLLVKLDTNGTNPKMLKKLIKRQLVDYIAMDIKAPLPKYAKVVKLKASKGKIGKSIKLIMKSGRAYEFRSTILPKLHTPEDILEMAKLIKGADKYFLQKFVPAQKLNNPEFSQLKAFSHKQMQELVKLCKNYVNQCSIR